mgnify:CR=1 FL=1
MRIRAAVLEEFGRPLVVQEVDLAEPGAVVGGDEVVAQALQMLERVALALAAQDVAGIG